MLLLWSEKWRKPQVIQGMTLAKLLKVLARNGFQVDTECLGRLAQLVAMGVLNHVYGACESLFNGGEIRRTTVNQPPLFVLGHWRSGTTHLHNLISLDERFASPSAYQSLFPHHFLFTQVAGPLFDLIAPRTRPMDNVAFGSHVPHEDEFALVALSGVSPYLCLLFPVTQDRTYSDLDLRRLPIDAIEEWKRSLMLFLRKLWISEGRRAVLKSPPHMGRIGVLLEMFPDAQFVHIVRNPYKVYLSCHKLWRSSFINTHLQTPSEALVDETILSWYERLFELFERDRRLIPAGSFHEMKFEDLESDPLGQLEMMYQDLGLSGFPELERPLISYLESIRDYRKNEYSLDARSREKVSRRWTGTFERYGYEL
jgi:hypothetical protein